MFKFHLENGNTATIAANDWGDAIKRFRTMSRGASFITDVEFKARQAAAKLVVVEGRAE